MLETAARKRANNEELMRMAVRIRDRAIRRAGELLTQLNGKGNNQHTAAAGPKLTQQQAAQDAGLSPRQQKDAVRIARIPAADFERQVESRTRRP